MKKYLFSILMILLLLGYFLPQMLSSQTGNQCLTWLFNHYTSSELSINDLKLSWKGPQTFDGIQWDDPTHYISFQCKQVHIQSSFFQLFKKHFKQAQIYSPSVTIHADLKPPQLFSAQHLPFNYLSFLPSMDLKITPFITGNIEIIDGMFSLFADEMQLALFKEVHAHLSLRHPLIPLYIEMKGISEQDDLKGNFMIKAYINELNFSHPQFEVSSQLHLFPIRGIDECLSIFKPGLKGVLLDLFGPTIDLQLNAVSSAQQSQLELQAKSRFLQATLSTLLKEGHLGLTTPAHVSLVIPPSLSKTILNKWMQIPHVAAIEGLQLQMAILDLKIPVEKEGINLTHLSCQAAIKSMPFKIQFNQIPLNMQENEISLSTANLSQSLNLTSKQTFKVQENQTQISLQSTWQQLFSPKIQGKTSLNLNAFPVKLLSTLLDPLNDPIYLLDTALDSQVLWEYTSQMSYLQLSVKSPLMDIPFAKFQMQHLITLMEPIDCTLKLPHFSQKGHIHVEELSVPVNNWNQLTAKLNIQLPQIDVHSPLGFLTESQGMITCSTLDSIGFTLESPHINVAGKAGFNHETKKLVNQQPIIIQYHPQKVIQDRYELPANLYLKILEFSCIGTQKDWPDTFIMKSSGSFDLPTQDPLSKMISFELYMDAPKQLLTCSLTGTALNGEIKSEKWNLKDPLSSPFQFTFTAKQLPTSFIESLCQKTLLHLLMGNVIDARIHGGFAEGALDFNAQVHSTFLECLLALQVKQGQLKIKEPVRLKWSISPEIFSDNFQKLPLQVTMPLSLNIQLGTFECPVKIAQPLHLTKWQFDLNQLAINGYFQVDPFTINQPSTKQEASLVSFKADIQKKPTDQLIAILCNGTFSQKDSLIQTTLKLTPGLDSHLQLETKIQKMPSLFIDLVHQFLTKTPSFFSAFLGNTVNLTTECQLIEGKGPFNVSFLCDHARFSLNGKWEKEELLLTSPIYAQMDITKEMSSHIFKEVNPLSITSIESQYPLTIEIAPKGFSARFFPFNMSNVTIEQGRIEVGRIRCRNEGNLNVALGLLKQNFSASAPLDLWFAPIDIHLTEGVMELERTEILVQDSLEICSWGTLNFNQKYVDMILGLTAQCLKKAFGIKNLPPNYVLQIPMKGPFNDVHIDTSKATTKITGLLLWQKGTGVLKGPGGALLGELAGKALLPDKDAKAPPAKHPFPWEEQKKQNVSLKEEPEKKPKKKCRIKKKEKPLKQLLKILK